MKALKVTCKVIVKEDRLSLKIPTGYKEYQNELLKYCVEKRGGFISLSLSAPKVSRTTGKGSQSHHLNGHCQQIAISTGQPFDDVKKHLKSQAIDRGYPMLENDDGSPQLDLWGNKQGISETDSTIEDCKNLIEQAHQFAAEYGIILEEGDNA